MIYIRNLIWNLSNYSTNGAKGYGMDINMMVMVMRVMPFFVKKMRQWLAAHCLLPRPGPGLI
jgi:hypothetical protein